MAVSLSYLGHFRAAETILSRAPQCSAASSLRSALAIPGARFAFHPGFSRRRAV